MGSDNYTGINKELERLVEEFKLAGKKRVFQVPTALKPHKYRAEYA